MSVIARVRAALTTAPRSADWLHVAFELAWLAPILAALAWAGGLVDPQPLDLAALLRFATIALFVPALAEEVIFRAALLPAPSSNPSLLRCALAIAAFLAWHPLQVLWFGDAWGAVVLNPWFLVAVVALGVATTRLYLATSSLWPPIALHWLVVFAWKVLGGASPWS